jgi:hypothetical protein
MNPTRKRLIALLATLLFVGLVVWMVSLRPRDSLAGLVPEHASWYLEVEKPLEVLKGVQKGVRLFSDPGLTVFMEWQEELEMATNLFRQDDAVFRFIQQASIGISAHAIEGKEAGYLFYLALPQAEHRLVFERLRRTFGKNASFRYEEREYLGKQIGEITFKKTGVVFTLAGSDDALVGSFSGFLVEEVIRSSGLLFKPNFASRLRRDSRYAAFAGKPVRLFIQLKNAPAFLQHYLVGLHPALKTSSVMGDALLLGFDAPDGPVWNSEGYLLGDQQEKVLRPQVLDAEMARFLPDPVVMKFQISSAGLWARFPSKKEGQEAFQKLLPQALGEECLMGMSEGDGLKKYHHLLVAKVQEPAMLQQVLDMASQEKDTAGMYRENVNGVLIRQHPNAGFAALLAGPGLQSWVPVFTAQTGSYFLLSEDVSLLRRAIDQASTRKAEGKGQSHHFSFSMDVGRSVPLLMESASGPLKAHFAEWLPLFRSMKGLQLQDQGEEEQPSLRLQVQMKIPSTDSPEPKEVKRIFLDSNLITPPFRLESRFRNSVFWVMQDQKNQAELLGPELELLHRIAMPARWTSRPQLLENVKGKDFNILYATPRKVQIVNAKGQSESGFALRLPDSSATIEHIRVVDYDQSLNYRFYMASRYGPVFAADRSGAFLDGWNPWNWNVPLQTAPRHIRIGEKDLILMLDRNGQLLLTNRKGEMQPGFPYTLKGRSDQPLFVEAGLELKNSYIYSLSELGQMEKLNLEGKYLSSIQLFRPDKDTRFQFCINPNQKTFSIARMHGNKVAIFDQSYRQVMEFTGKGNRYWVQHFQFGASRKLYAITDLEAQTCHLFSETGTPLNQQPIEASQPIDLIAKPDADQRYQLLVLFKNRVALYEFVLE